MNVDPTDDCTFWYVNEYYMAEGQASSVAGWQAAASRSPATSELSLGAWKTCILYIVTDALTDPKLHRIQNPAAHLPASEEVTVVQYLVDEASWRRAAKPDAV